MKYRLKLLIITSFVTMVFSALVPYSVHARDLENLYSNGHLGHLATVPIMIGVVLMFQAFFAVFSSDFDILLSLDSSVTLKDRTPGWKKFGGSSIFSAIIGAALLVLGIGLWVFHILT